MPEVILLEGVTPLKRAHNHLNYPNPIPAFLPPTSMESSLYPLLNLKSIKEAAKLFFSKAFQNLFLATVLSLGSNKLL